MMDDDTEKSLRAMLEDYGREIEAAVEGRLYEIDEGLEVIDDLDVWRKAKWDEAKDKFLAEHPGADFDGDLYDSVDDWVEDEVGSPDDIDGPEEVDLAGYIDRQSLGDVRFEVDTRKEVCGGKVLLAYGGPNVWLHDGSLEGYWGGSHVSRSLDSDTSHALFRWFEETWEAMQ